MAVDVPNDLGGPVSTEATRLLRPRRASAPLLALCALLSVLLLVGPATASAQKRTKVSGQTAVKLNDAGAGAFAAAGVTVEPLAPATAGDSGLVFPARGLVNLTNNTGVVPHRGGIKLTKGDVVVRLRRPVVRVTKKNAFVSIEVVRLRGLGKKGGKKEADPKTGKATRHGFRFKHRRVRLFALSNLNRTDANGTATVTADAALTPRASKLLTKAFGGTFPAGVTVATATLTLSASAAKKG